MLYNELASIRVLSLLHQRLVFSDGHSVIFSVLTHSTSSENPSTASDLCFCYSFCSLVICTVIPFVSHWCNSSTLHSFVSFSVLLLTIQYLLQWRLFCSSELKHTQVGFCPDLNPPLFRPRSNFSFSSSFFHGRCL